MTSNSLTENEEQDIPSHILKTIFGLHASFIFRPKYVWFSVHLKGPMIPDPSGQLAELIVYITSTRVDLYSHQVLLVMMYPVCVLPTPLCDSVSCLTNVRRKGYQNDGLLQDCSISTVNAQEILQSCINQRKQVFQCSCGATTT